MNDITFFMLAHKRAKATDFALSTVRKSYPFNKIILFENGSNVLKDTCIKYNVEYHQQSVNFMSPLSGNPEGGIYAGMSKKTDFYLLYQQLKYVCEKASTKWLLFLEPDVVIRDTIKTFPNASVGCTFRPCNKYKNNSFEHTYINNYRKEKGMEIFESYQCGCSGGSILNREHLFAALSEANKHVDNVVFTNGSYNYREICHIDFYMSFLFIINGYKLEDWCEHYEDNKYNLKNFTKEQQYGRVFGAVVHDFKYFYD